MDIVDIEFKNREKFRDKVFIYIFIYINILFI